MTGPRFAVTAVETIGVDLPALAGAFARRLHDAGVPVTPERAARFADALALVRPVARRRLYWTARAVFVSDATQVKAFDAVFREVFGSRVAAPTPPRPRIVADRAARGPRHSARSQGGRQGRGRRESPPPLRAAAGTRAKSAMCRCRWRRATRSACAPSASRCWSRPSSRSSTGSWLA